MTEPTEPVYDWDRDCPDMSVGTHYPCMYDFRLAVRQHAVVNEFEPGAEKFDTSRFRGFCKAAGCPWILDLGLNKIRVSGFKRTVMSITVHLEAGFLVGWLLLLG